MRVDDLDVRLSTGSNSHVCSELLPGQFCIYFPAIVSSKNGYSVAYVMGSKSKYIKLMYMKYAR